MSDEGKDDYYSSDEREARRVEREARRVEREAEHAVHRAEHIAHEAERKAQKVETHAHDMFEFERRHSLRLRVERAADTLCLIFVALWILSVWRWPFVFLAEYMEIFFLISVGLAYLGSVAGARSNRLLFSNIATTSILYVVAIWLFLPSSLINAYPWNSYMTFLATLFVLTLTASLLVGGAGAKWDRVSDRIGTVLHGIALIVWVIWLFGSNGILSPLGLHPSMFPGYLILLGFGTYILGSVVRVATFPIRRVAIERVAYSVAWGSLGAIMVTLLLRWLGFLAYSILPEIERTLFILFVGTLVVGVALSETKSVEMRKRETEIRKTWWWERFSKPVRESAIRLSEELGKLKLSDTMYVLPLGAKAVNTERVRVEAQPDTLAVPIISVGVEVGAIYVGTGDYHVNANVKEFTDRFDGEAIVFTSPRAWQEMRGEQKWLQAYPENIKNARFEKAEDVRRVAESRLNQFKQFGERTRTAEAETGRKISDVNIPGVSVEEGPGYERVRLPFIEVISGPEGNYVSVGPLKVWDSGGRSVVKFGPFLAVDESVPDAISKPSKILIAITDRSRESLDVAALRDEIILRKGSTNLHVKGTHISLIDDGTSVRITSRAKEIRTSKLWLFVKPKVKAKLFSGTLKFKAFADGTVVMRGSTGQVTKAKDPAMALRLISQLDEMVDDLTRAALEKRELEELSSFFSQMDSTFEDEKKKNVNSA